MRYYVDSPASVVGGFTTLEKVIYDLVGDIYLNTIVDDSELDVIVRTLTERMNDEARRRPRTKPVSVTVYSAGYLCPADKVLRIGNHQYCLKHIREDREVLGA